MNTSLLRSAFLFSLLFWAGLCGFGSPVQIQFNGTITHIDGTISRYGSDAVLGAKASLLFSIDPSSFGLHQFIDSGVPSSDPGYYSNELSYYRIADPVLASVGSFSTVLKASNYQVNRFFSNSWPSDDSVTYSANPVYPYESLNADIATLSFRYAFGSLPDFSLHVEPPAGWREVFFTFTTYTIIPLDDGRFNWRQDGEVRCSFDSYQVISKEVPEETLTVACFALSLLGLLGFTRARAKRLLKPMGSNLNC